MTSSSLGRKQRKTLYNLTWQKRRKKLSVHLESKLIEKYNVRSLPAKKGDTVKVIRGDADILGHEAKVALVHVKNMKIIVEGITRSKADGKQKQRYIDPSNLLLIKLDLSDPKRRRRIEKKGKLAEGAVKDEEEKKALEAAKEDEKKEAEAGGENVAGADKKESDGEPADEESLDDGEADEKDDGDEKPAAAGDKPEKEKKKGSEDE